MTTAKDAMTKGPNGLAGCIALPASAPCKPYHAVRSRWLMCFVLACIAISGAGRVSAAIPETNSAASLRAQYLALGERLSRNQFQRPLYLDSAESSNHLRGDIYALVDYPFADVNAALSRPTDWCDVLILHLNTKYCRGSTDQAGTIFTVRIGKKADQPIDDAYRVEFAFRAAAPVPTFLEVQLDAATGPLNTSNYHILVEAIPVEGGRTFLHLKYAYDFGFAGRMAMQVYLATAGSGKVGFTITGRKANGEPEYIDGVRGVVERNAMRYYLAVDAYLGALATPPAAQLEKRLQTWFNSTERYSRQLREMERDAYMEMKRREVMRQQVAR